MGMEEGRKPLSLALIRQRYTPFGGAERFVERALAPLRARGVAITLIARRWDAGTEGVRTRVCDPFYLGRWWRDAGFARGVGRMLREGAFQLVQTHERIPGCDIYRAGDGVHREWLRQRGRQLSPLARGLVAVNPYHRYLLEAERRLFEHPALKAVICNSRMVREEILASFRIDAARLEVIYSGVDTERFHPERGAAHREEVRRAWGVGPEEVLLLFVGSGFRRKGVPALLAALARTPSRFRLLVVGRDKEQKGMEALAGRLGVAGRVGFAGGRTEVVPFYGAADAVVLPTLYDPFPNVALEAMAMGLPLVTSLKCGAVDLIVHGENGLLADALDVEALAANLLRLGEPGVRASMGSAARATVLPMTLEAMSGRLLALYERLLAEGATLTTSGG